MNLIAKCTSDEVYVEYYGILGKMYNSNLTPLEIFEKGRQLSDDYFDVILTRDDVQKTKPNPEVYNKIADKLGVSKNEILIKEYSNEMERYKHTFKKIQMGHIIGIVYNQLNKL